MTLAMVDTDSYSTMFSPSQPAGEGHSTLPAWPSAHDRSIAIVTQQISNYHAARYRAAERVFGKVSILSTMNDADFPEFLAVDASKISVFQLFQGRREYLAAIADGAIWSATHLALERICPEVVAIAGWSFPESHAAIAWARRRGARVVMMSASQHRDASRFRLREAVKSRIVMMCDAALVGGRSQAAYVMKLGMPRDRVFLGYDAVDNEHFSDGAKAARTNRDASRRSLGLPLKYLLASARFIPKKNLVRLVEAFAKALMNTRTEHCLVILGDGPERESIHAKIQSLELKDRVLLLGLQSYADLPAFYALADGFVHVSLTDQWGLVINEAAAAGLPLVVSHTCGAVEELVEAGINGVLVKPTDIDNIAEALAEIMTATPDVLAERGRQSYRIVSSWGPERFAEGLSAAAAAALARRHSELKFMDRALLRTASMTYQAKVS